MIKFELQTITPEKAISWLQNNNKGNRAIRDKVAKRYARDIVAGNWRVTHQCIAFGADGNLLDGQHRLTAVALANKTIKAYVATYGTVEQALQLPIDIQVKRTAYEILSVSRKDQETLSAMFRVLRSGGNSPSVSEIETGCRNARLILDGVHGCITNNVRHRTSAPVRAALVFLSHEYPDHRREIWNQYNKFIRLNFDGLWSSLMALVKCFDGLSTRTTGQDQIGMVVRAYHAFAPHNKNLKIIRITDQDGTIRHIRQTGAWAFQRPEDIADSECVGDAEQKS